MIDDYTPPLLHYVIRNVRGKLEDAATRCVLTPVDVSKCVCGRGSALDPLGELKALPYPLAGFEGGKRGRAMERARDGRGTEEEERTGREGGK